MSCSLFLRRAPEGLAFGCSAFLLPRGTARPLLWCLRRIGRRRGLPARPFAKSPKGLAPCREREPMGLPPREGRVHVPRSRRRRHCRRSVGTVALSRLRQGCPQSQVKTLLAQAGRGVPRASGRFSAETLHVKTTVSGRFPVSGGSSFLTMTIEHPLSAVK